MAMMLARSTSPQITTTTQPRTSASAGVQAEGAAGVMVLVPVGSTEQHGPHLPLNTDTVIAEAAAHRVAAHLHEGATTGIDRVVVAPALPYGASGEHQDFPGTVSIGTATLHDVIIELTRSLTTWAHRVAFINGHGGNIGALATAIDQLRAEGHLVTWAPCATPGGDAHAGRAETSLMMYLQPGTVHTDLARPGNTTPLPDLMPQLVTSGVAAVSTNGILGDPTGATKEEGRNLLAAMTQHITNTIITTATNTATTTPATTTARSHAAR